MAEIIGKIVKNHMSKETKLQEADVGAMMEFVLDGLHQNSMLSKDSVNSRVSYRDMLDTMFSSFGGDDDDFMIDR